MDGHIEIVKQLIDSLTVQLTNIIIKLEAINPVLNRLSEDSEDGQKISKETIDLIKKLKENIDNQNQSISSLSLPTAIQKIDEIKASTDLIKKLMVPVSKLCKFIMKPLGVVIFLLTSIGIITGIIEAVQWFTSK